MRNLLTIKSNDIKETLEKTNRFNGNIQLNFYQTINTKLKELLKKFNYDVLDINYIENEVRFLVDHPYDFTITTHNFRDSALEIIDEEFTYFNIVNDNHTFANELHKRLKN